jgi:hypothetical protein
MGIPMGTVMSTLSRARDRFRLAAGYLCGTSASTHSDRHALNERDTSVSAARNKLVAV